MRAARRRGDLLPRRPRRIRPASGPRLSAVARARRPVCIQGNYDNSIGNGPGRLPVRLHRSARQPFRPPQLCLHACTTPAPSNRAWLRQLPGQRRLELGRYRVLLCHGSPRRHERVPLGIDDADALSGTSVPTATTPTVILATHTGIKWHRPLSGDRHFVNVGVLGRPENDGRTNVWYALLEAEPGFSGRVRAGRSTIRSGWPARCVRRSCRRSSCETVRTGWWTTCLEMLPAKERRRGRY